MTDPAVQAQKENFKAYLEGAGVIDALTKVLVGLYESPEQPKDAMGCIRDALASSSAEMARLKEELSALSSENNALRSKMARLHEENAALKSEVDRLSNPVKNA